MARADGVPTLYGRAEALAVVDTWFDEFMPEIAANDGEVPDALAAVLDMAQGDFSEKVERVALKRNQMLVEAAAVSGQADAIKREAERLYNRARQVERRAKLIEKYLQFCLEKANVPKVRGLLVNVRVQKNGQPSIAVAATPDALREHVSSGLVREVPPSAPTWELDRAAVLAAWKRDGQPDEYQPLPGVSLTRGSHVRID